MLTIYQHGFVIRHRDNFTSIRFESFAATESSEVFSGDWLCKYEVIIQQFGDCL